VTGRTAAGPRNIEETALLREALQTLMDHGSRINVNKQGRYWYPLSLATYGVDEVLAAVDSLCSFRTSMWTKTAEFERRFAETQGSGEAVMVNSGSSADLLIAFASVNPSTRSLSPGDEVLVPAVTWPTQIWSLMMAGLKVRFVDVDPASLNVDLKDLERKIGPRTRAISLVHLMGNPNDMHAITEITRKRSLLLFEDCCEALGARFGGRSVGTFGTASAFSFFFSHHITTMEGGMICTDDPQLSDLFRLLRAHGWARNLRHRKTEPVDGIDERYVFLNWGFNVRPTELQAAFGIEQLGRLPEFTEHRVRNATYFAGHLERFGDTMRTMRVHPLAECSWFALPLVLAPECPFSKRALLAYLEEQGVETRPIVAGNLARQPVVDLFPEIREMDLPGADVIHDRGFYIGLHPVDSRAQLDRLAEIMDGFVRTHA
jgi:CDP-6-deoxy-D-xylo-4-hexulose-3-dehydrase